VPGIFLSYRRRDSDYAILLYAWLTERFGSEFVFWDREDIDPGKDFRNALIERLRAAKAVVALVGPGWSPSPWIRREIAGALKKRILILPVMVGDVRAIQAKALPRSIRKLAVLQSLDATDLRFRSQLIEALERVVKPTAVRAAPADLQTQRLAQLLLEQSDRLQLQALKLLVSGHVAEALDVLNETFTLLMALLDFHPGDIDIQVRLGYLYKDLASSFAPGDRQHQRNLANGFKTFKALLENERQLDRSNRAGAWNGLGNMYLIAGDYAQGIDCCRRAVELLPTYTHAWGDLFAGYEGLAERGAIDLQSMTLAVRRVKATAKDEPIYDAKEIAALERRLEGWRRKATARARPKRAAKNRSQ